MTLRWCRSYCMDYGRCVHVIFAFDQYRKNHGENCPLENLAFEGMQCPPCFTPRTDVKMPGTNW